MHLYKTFPVIRAINSCLVIRDLHLLYVGATT